MSRKVWIAALIGAAVVAAAGGSFVATQKHRGTFFSRTYLNEADISGKTPEEAAEEILSARKAIRIQILEGGTVSTAGSSEEFGYTLDKEKLIASLQEALEKQRGSAAAAFRSLVQDAQIPHEEVWNLDEEVLFRKIDSRNLNVKRTPSRDAELVFNEETGLCEIQPAVYGNQFSPEDMRAWAKAELDDFFSGTADGRTSCRIEVPASVYRQPAVTEDDPALAELADAYNEYAGTSVTYTFGSQKEVVSFPVFKDWLIYDDGSFVLDEDAVADYVTDLAATYDTRGREKDFVNHWGETVHFTSGQVEYGYRILQGEETEQLIADLKSGQAVVREPVYDLTDRWDDPCCYSRDGMDDLNGTYIEVSIADQYVWFYKDGEVIVETDCVTGNHERGWDTTHGVYGISSKASPAVLRGEGYETPVTYWMPFNGGQGLHDASWRGNFGGKIYRSNGSHGCVNLPSWAAAKIYENCKSGMAVVVY